MDKLIEKDGCWWVEKHFKDITVPIQVSNFVMRFIQSHEKYNGDLLREYEFINTKGQKGYNILTAPQLTSNAKFKVACSESGNFIWMGKNRDDITRLLATLYEGAEKGAK